MIAGVAASAAESAQLRTQFRAQVSPQIFGASANQRQALTQILATMPDTAISKIVLHISNRPTNNLWDADGIRRGTIWISYEASAADERTVWDEWVLAAAFRDASAAAQLTEVTGMRAVGAPFAQLIAPPPREPTTTASLPTGQVAFEHAVRSALSASGATIENVTFIGTPYGAVAARLHTSDPAPFLKYHAAQLVAAISSLTRIGFYLQLDDAAGPVWKRDVVSRRSSWWTRPDLVSCYPILAPAIQGSTQPISPCPA